jgi:hypothetical protein
MTRRILLLAAFVALSACSTGYMHKDGTIVWKMVDEGLGTHYATIGGVDAPTFVDLGNDFAKDKNHVYFGTVQSDADPATFVVLGEHFGKDSRRAYFGVIPLADVDLASFHAMKGAGYARDDNSCFYQTWRIDCAQAPGR